MLTFDEISDLVADVVRGLDMPAEAVAATPGGHDTSRVEVVLTLPGNAEQPRRLLLGLDRHRSESELRRTIENDIRGQLNRPAD